MTIPSGRPPTILIVEDIDWIRLGMKQAVERCGYLVEEAKNDLEALEVAKHHPLDMILTEDSAPSFKALVESVHHHPAFRDVPIVIVNPDADEASRSGETFVIKDYEGIARLLGGPSQRDQ